MWSRLPQPCKPVRCGAQHLIHNAVVMSHSTLAGVGIVYYCMYGYGFPDTVATKVIRCNETSLEWETLPGDWFFNMTCDGEL